MKMVNSFMVVDDDLVNNMICTGVIKNTLKDADVITFQYPAEALDYIEKNFNNVETTKHTILLLDINMPTISGWQFLERFKNFSLEIKKHFIIYILSSSISTTDKMQASKNKYVKRFLEKPFNTKALNELISDFD